MIVLWTIGRLIGINYVCPNYPVVNKKIVDRAHKIGMKVYVFTDSGWYQYEVGEITEVSPNKTEVVAPTENEILTLYTCSGFSDSKRLIIVAYRVEN